jgi:hypothetical protein
MRGKTIMFNDAVRPSNTRPSRIYAILPVARRQIIDGRKA